MGKLSHPKSTNSAWRLSDRRDVEEGGETVFPHAPLREGQRAGEYSECGMQGLAVKPRRGDALLFWSVNPDGSTDPDSLHGGCPVIRGTKWSATKWMREETRHAG